MLAARLGSGHEGEHLGFAVGVVERFIAGDEISAARRDVLDRCFAEWTAYPYTMPAALVPPHWTKPTRDFLIPIATQPARAAAAEVAVAEPVAGLVVDDEVPVVAQPGPRLVPRR